MKIVSVAQGRTNKLDLHVTATVDPHKHRQAFYIVLVVVIRVLMVVSVWVFSIFVNAVVSQSCFGGSPDIQVQTVLGHVGVWIPHFLTGESRKVLVSEMILRRKFLFSIFFSSLSLVPLSRRAAIRNENIKISDAKKSVNPGRNLIILPLRSSEDKSTNTKWTSTRDI
jgi:hypothetical protein